MVKRSHGKLSNLFVDAHHAGRDRHVHELGFSVHLKTTLDVLVNLVLDSESFAGVLGIGLKGCENL